MKFSREIRLDENNRFDAVRVVIPRLRMDKGRDCGFIRIEALDGQYFAQMALSGSPQGNWGFETRLGGHYRESDDLWIPHSLGDGYRVIVEADVGLWRPRIAHARRGRHMPKRHHSVAVGTAGTGQLLANAGSGGITWSHTTSGGSNRLITIYGGYGSSVTTAPTHTSDYNSAGMSVGAVASFNSGPGTYRPEALIDYQIAPSSGSHTASIAFGQTTNAGMVGSTDWTGVNQSTPIAASPIQVTGTTAGGSELITNGSLTTPTNGALLDGFFLEATNTISGSSGTTVDWADDGTSDFFNWGAGQHTLNSGSQTLGWNVDSGAPRYYAHVVAGIQEAGGGVDEFMGQACL